MAGGMTRLMLRMVERSIVPGGVRMMRLSTRIPTRPHARCRLLGWSSVTGRKV